MHSNIGNDASALWKHYDDSIDDKTLVLRQQLHVSILSLGSFAGRLLSGTLLGVHVSRGAFSLPLIPLQEWAPTSS